MEIIWVLESADDVVLSEAKDLFVAGKEQVLRFAQDDILTRLERIKCHQGCGLRLGPEPGGSGQPVLREIADGCARWRTRDDRHARDFGGILQ